MTFKKARLVRQDLDLFMDWVEASGAQVDRLRDGYRVFMYRDRADQWTQVWGGEKKGRPRPTLKVVGPEADKVQQFQASSQKGGV